MDVSKDKLNSIIAEIAEHNDCGMNAFVHRKSLKLIFIPNEFRHDLDDVAEFYIEDLTEIDNNFDLFFKIEPPNSHESFNIMKDFAENLDQDKLKNVLISALNNRKPFSNFKHIVDNSDIREKWFEFKNQELINRVKIEFKHEMPGHHMP